jgi:hypothetical protein
VKASVWVGDAESLEALEAVLTPDRACDGDSLGSEFSRAIGHLGLVDAVREVRVVPAPTASLASLLDGLSFSNRLLGALPHTLESPATAVVVFFGVEVPEGEVRLGATTLRRLGVVFW